MQKPGEMDPDLRRQIATVWLTSLRTTAHGKRYGFTDSQFYDESGGRGPYVAIYRGEDNSLDYFLESKEAHWSYVDVADEWMWSKRRVSRKLLPILRFAHVRAKLLGLVDI